MKVTKRLGSILFLMSFPMMTLVASDEDDDKALNQAMEDAQKKAAELGIKVPDATRPPEEMDKENGEKSKEATDETKNETEHKPAVTLPLTALPEWVPSISEFQPAGKATRKQEDGIETGEMNGTSSTAPEAIADAWHEAANTRKLSFERQNSDINGRKSIHVRIADLNGGGGEATLDLEPGKRTKVEVSYKIPVTASPATH